MTRRFQYRVILVGVDFSMPSRQAMARAADLAERFEAHLEVVHVVEKMEPAIPFSERNRVAVRRLQRELTEAARKRLLDFVPAAARRRATTRVLAGKPETQLMAHAERCGADLVVLANRGHSPLEELLIGSTAERVLRGTLLPVLLVSVARRGRAAG